MDVFDPDPDFFHGEESMAAPRLEEFSLHLSIQLRSRPSLLSIMPFQTVSYACPVLTLVLASQSNISMISLGSS